MQLVNSGCLNMFNYIPKSWLKSSFFRVATFIIQIISNNFSTEQKELSALDRRQWEFSCLWRSLSSGPCIPVPGQGVGLVLLLPPPLHLQSLPPPARCGSTLWAKRLQTPKKRARLAADCHDAQTTPFWNHWHYWIHFCIQQKMSWVDPGNQSETYALRTRRKLQNPPKITLHGNYSSSSAPIKAT